MLLEYFRCSCSKHCHYNSKWRESNLQQALQNGGHRGLCLLSSSSFPLGKRQRVTSALLGTGSYSNYTPATALGTGTGTAGQHQAKLAKPGALLPAGDTQSQWTVQGLLPAADGLSSTLVSWFRKQRFEDTCSRQSIAHLPLAELCYQKLAGVKGKCQRVSMIFSPPISCFALSTKYLGRIVLL